MSDSQYDLKRAKIKLSIAKLIEIAYTTNQGLTASILSKKGPAKLTVDQYSNATLASSAGIVTFKGSPALEALGAKVKAFSVNFTNSDGMTIRYTASVDVKAMTVLVSGSFDLEALITSCSGLLCRASRAMKGRSHALELEQQRIMGY